MPIVTKEYQSKVLDEIDSYKSLVHPVKASIPERLFVRKIRKNKLHPNPSDEFSMAEIGPNFSIIKSYEDLYMRSIKRGDTPEIEPLIVEKMSTGGYMILNGHHRWLAINRISKIKRIPVEIVNVTPIDDIIWTIKQSSNHICVSFDFDEVLLTDGTIHPAHKKLPFPFNKIYTKTLRKNASYLINALSEIGCDVWIYTGNYKSEQYIEGLFSLHDTKVYGIINGLRNKRSKELLREAFTNKYKLSVHIDGSSVLCVNTGTKEYEMYDIPENDIKWAGNAFEIIKNNDLVKRIIIGS